MTIASQQNTITVQGNGATINFNYNFLMDDATHAVVIYTDPQGVVTTLNPGAYGLTGVGVPAGGTFSYQPGGNPMPVGSTLTLSRQVPYTQTTTIANQGNFYPAVIEAALDYLTMQTQQINQALSRSVLLPLNIDPTLYTLTLPTPLANAILGWDPTGKILSNVIHAGSVPLPLTIANGGTGGVTAGAARTNLGISAAMDPVVTAATLAAGRTALGSGATGDSVFTSATAAAARAILGVAAAVAGVFTSPQMTVQVLAAGANIAVDMSLGTAMSLTLGAAANNISNPTNLAAGQWGWIDIKQDATGNRTITSWGANWKFIGGVKPVGSTTGLSTAANAVDRVYWVCTDGATVHCTFGGNFS